MSGSGCNHNQNHLVHNGRSTSRVLQPPGGASSFSIGGGNFADNSNSNRNRAHLKQREPEPDRYSTNSRDMGQGRNRSDSTDSLDRLMNSRGPRDSGPSNCSIPGLETHYGRSSSDQNSNPSYVSNPSRFSGRSSNPVGQQEYAAQLKAQIDYKKGLDRDSDDRGRGIAGSSSNRRNSSESSYSSGSDRGGGSGNGERSGSRPPPLPVASLRASGGGGGGEYGGRDSGIDRDRGNYRNGSTNSSGSTRSNVGGGGSRQNSFDGGGGGGGGGGGRGGGGGYRADAYGDDIGGSGNGNSRSRGQSSTSSPMVYEEKGIAGLRGRVKQNPGGNSSFSLGWA